MKKKIPFPLFAAGVFQVEYIPHNITDHVLLELILVGHDEYFCIYLPRNSI